MNILPHYWTAKTQHRTGTKYIVIHHAAATYKPSEAVASIYNYHKTKWPGYGAAGYHIILQEEKDGTISTNLVNCPYVVGAGVERRNHETFHICLAADFTKKAPNSVWINATKSAISFAKTLFPSAVVVGHRDIALSPTACPGAEWPRWKDLLFDDIFPGFRKLDTFSYIVSSPIRVPPLVLEGIVKRIATFQRSVRVYSEQDIAQIVQTYHDLCLYANMYFLVPLAQMLHETGWLTSFWSHPPQRNPAGIGVTGEYSATKPDDPTGWAYNTQRARWERGISFESWVDHSIPAHVGRLLAYALTDDEANNEQRELIAKALSYRPLPSTIRGKCKQLHHLQGTWAVPGFDYARRIAELANSLVSHVI